MNKSYLTELVLMQTLHVFMLKTSRCLLALLGWHPFEQGLEFLEFEIFVLF